MPYVGRDRRRLINHQPLESESPDIIRVIGGQEPHSRRGHSDHSLELHPTWCPPAYIDESFSNHPERLNAAFRDVISRCHPPVITSAFVRSPVCQFSGETQGLAEPSPGTNTTKTFVTRVVNISLCRMRPVGKRCGHDLLPILGHGRRTIFREGLQESLPLHDAVLIDRQFCLSGK